jgi:hypothetical protein
MNLKVGFRGMPDFRTSKAAFRTGRVRQSSFAVMADIGAQNRFNFLKMYNSRDRTSSWASPREPRPR